MCSICKGPVCPSVCNCPQLYNFSSAHFPNLKTIQTPPGHSLHTLDRNYSPGSRILKCDLRTEMCMQGPRTFFLSAFLPFTLFILFLLIKPIFRGSRRGRRRRWRRICRWWWGHWRWGWTRTQGWRSSRGRPWTASPTPKRRTPRHPSWQSAASCEGIPPEKRMVNQTFKNLFRLRFKYSNIRMS